MTIDLISKQQHDTILNIYNSNKALFLQNDGYQYIDKYKFSEEDTKAFKQVTDILNNHVHGFSEFSNFYHNKKDKAVTIRLQYNYGHDGGHSFTGVGYIKLNELLKGFDD